MYVFLKILKQIFYVGISEMKGLSRLNTVKLTQTFGTRSCDKRSQKYFLCIFKRSVALTGTRNV